MTKRHFEYAADMIVSAILQGASLTEREQLTSFCCELFLRFNANFDPGRFHDWIDKKVAQHVAA